MTEKLDDINCKILINLVRDRPILWDRSQDMEKGNPRTFEAWREVFCCLKKDFEKLPFMERSAYGIDIIKQWNSLRDSWLKFHRRVIEKKVRPKAIKRFLFYDDMAFLTKTFIQSNKSDLLLETIPITHEPHDDDTETQSPKAKKKKEDITVEVDPNTLNYINNIEPEQESRAMSFFKGITPSIDGFTDEEMVQFQHEVTRIVMQIQKNRHSCTCFKRKDNKSHNGTSNSAEIDPALILRNIQSEVTVSPLHSVKSNTSSPLTRSETSASPLRTVKEAAHRKSKSPEIMISSVNNLNLKLNSQSELSFFLSDCYTIKNE